MKKIYLIIIVLLSLIAPVFAQQDASYNMYMFNGFYLNPAYAGSNNVLSMVAIYRQQWIGVPGAPRTFNISANSPLKQDQYALGITIADDNLGLTNAFSITPAFAFRPLVKKVRVSIGVQGSFTYFTKNNSEAILAQETMSDQVYIGTTKLFVPNVGVGLYVNDNESRKFFVGLSIPHLLPYSLKKNGLANPGHTDVSQLYNYYLLTGGYVIGKRTSIIKVMPSVLLMWQEGLPRNIPDIDINAMMFIYDRVKVGVSYRTGGDRSISGESVVGMAEVKVTKQLRVGYAYEANVSKFSRVNTGSHEVMLGYDFWYNKKRFVSPRFGRYF